MIKDNEPKSKQVISSTNLNDPSKPSNFKFPKFPDDFDDPQPNGNGNNENPRTNRPVRSYQDKVDWILGEVRLHEQLAYKFKSDSIWALALQLQDDALEIEKIWDEIVEQDKQQRKAKENKKEKEAKKTSSQLQEAISEALKHNAA